MIAPTFVFIHGGLHSKSCWNPTLDALRSLDPDVKLLAVNLPGREDEPGDLKNLTIAQCVDSVVSKIQAINPERVILVGHSMAGLTIPGVVVKLGKALVQRVVFLAACVPAKGESVIVAQQSFEAVSGIIMQIFSPQKDGIAYPMNPFISTWIFANSMTKEQKQFMLKNLCPESVGLLSEPVNHPDALDVPIDWIMTTRDRMVSVKSQRKYIANLGGVDRIFEIETCHDAMISEPAKLARMLLERC